MKNLAQFETAYYLTNKIEGGYYNNKNDAGGETYRGISRVTNPYWLGWDIVDNIKKTNFSAETINEALDKNEVLQNFVKVFYLNNYWDAILGNKIADQQIANEVYDNAVNMGVPQAGIYLQKVINILNRNQSLYKDITVDGKIGGGTIQTLEMAIKLNGSRRVLNVINGYQMKHYLECMEKNPVDEIFVGWFDRVEIVWH